MKFTYYDNNKNTNTNKKQTNKKIAQVYAYLEKKEKENSPLKNVNQYAGNYVVLGFFSLSMPPLIEFSVSSYKP